MSPRAIGTLALAWVAVVSAFVRAQEPIPFRSSAEAVRVDVEVRNGRTPVTGLVASDFELRDSGVLQRIEAISLADVPLSVLLAFDVSSSVAGETLEQLKEAARAVVGAMRPDDQAALLVFSERVGLKTGWTDDRARLTSAIDRLTASGATAVRDGLFAAIALQQEAKGRTLIVVFSDGEDTSSWLPATAVIKAARETDAVVYAVTSRLLTDGRMDRGLMDALRTEMKRRVETQPALFPQMLLERVAEDTGGELLSVERTKELPSTLSRILGDFKSRYMLSYSPSGVAASGWHPLEVKLKRGKRGTVQARRGYAR
jgi:VWFA-related protein